MLNVPSAQDLFTYGSLMCEDIMAEVAGARLRCSPADLAGYRRFLVKEKQLPGLVADPTGTVAGIVYHDITDHGWSRLDRFEGIMYDRIPLSVQYENDTKALVCCYVSGSNSTTGSPQPSGTLPPFSVAAKQCFRISIAVSRR